MESKNNLVNSVTMDLSGKLWATPYIAICKKSTQLTLYDILQNYFSLDWHIRFLQNLGHAVLDIVQELISDSLLRVNVGNAYVYS
jgi:hypothetical protein